MTASKAETYHVVGYNLLTMRDRIAKITSDIDNLTITHNRVIAQLQAELVDLNNKILEEGFVLSQDKLVSLQKASPRYWLAGDTVKRISHENPNVYTFGKEYKVMSVSNEDGVHVLKIHDDYHKPQGMPSYCVYHMEEAEEKFELVK